MKRRDATTPPPGIVFTDLDGTLLDHDDYGWEPARPAVEALSRAGVPLVLCSSKTRAEMLAVQKDLGVAGPFIPENGGAVLLTGAGPWAAEFPSKLKGLPARLFGAPYAELRSGFVELRRRFGPGMTGFGDVDDRQVAEWTGLPLAQARLARERDFDEPFLWEPEPEGRRVDAARSWLAGRGLNLTRGGRFWHVTGMCDKGKAVRWLLLAAGRLWGAVPRSLALGDSENDLPMLQVVGEGVLVERPGGGHLPTRPRALHTVGGVGPVGWARAVEEWLARGRR